MGGGVMEYVVLADALPSSPSVLLRTSRPVRSRPSRRIMWAPEELKASGVGRRQRQASSGTPPVTTTLHMETHHLAHLSMQARASVVVEGGHLLRLRKPDSERCATKWPSLGFGSFPLCRRCGLCS
ncbi:uncharacterized [Tachysurus ichikawai]